ncbi:hypothetical protein [Desulfobacter latus]|uniref:Uncharacterized protein n=1 Tax=Desulfobacter latus TaxID=2292 RepID=A0A850TCT9_9BACT|nr:hypothetical protein [Desulfobacter latus]NWH06077.1 hypothetical protein [Desulfobacter latus]
MNPEKETEIFKKGIWIKEQQGVLTVGSLDKNNTDVMVLSDKLSSRLRTFESDIIEAIYGESREAFQPGGLDIEHLFRQLKKRFENVRLQISFDKSDEKPFICNFDSIFSLFEKLILSSISGNSKPVIYINASLVQDHLCIIYRDSESVSKPSDLGPEFFLIKNRLDCRVQFNKADKKGTYYDITIPSADR